MGIAERIISERKRLSLSQAEFAHRAGVSLSSQKRYEKGERNPDTTYLDALRLLGIDPNYLVFGVPTEAYESDHFTAMEWFLADLADALGLEKGAFTEPVDELSRAVHQMVDEDETTPFSALSQRLVWGALEHSPFFNGSVADGLLKDFLTVLEAVESVQDRLSTKVLPEKKARTVEMLYRVYRDSGNLDPKTIEQALTLAAS